MTVEEFWEFVHRPEHGRARSTSSAARLLKTRAQKGRTALLLPGSAHFSKSTRGTSVLGTSLRDPV